MTMNISKTALNTIVRHRQFFMINSEQMKERSVDVIDLRRIVSIQWFVSPLIGLTVGCSPLDATSTKPVRKDERIVIASCAALGRWHTPKFGCPHDQGILQHVALFQILNQSRRAVCHAERERAMVPLDIFMGVPVSPGKAVVVATPDLNESDPSFH